MNTARAAELAHELMDQHLNREWSFHFDHAKTRLGSCDSRNKIITLSRPLAEINEEILVHDTILHEIAHAKAGARAGHGPRWKEWAVKLGAKPRRELGVEVSLPSARFLGRCPGCAQVINRHRRTAIACADCCKRFNGGRWSERYLFDWSDAVEASSEELNTPSVID